MSMKVRRFFMPFKEWKFFMSLRERMVDVCLRQSPTLTSRSFKPCVRGITRTHSFDLLFRKVYSVL